jgi:7-keto-8-aminopelargonate synthetase-like enzyme
MVCFYHPECHPSLKNAIFMNNMSAYEIPADASEFEKIIRIKGKRPLIVTDGIYGDLPPLDIYSKLADIFDGLLLVDEAHSMGILGKHGRGAAEHFGINMERVLISGSLSKAVGTGGGFAAGPKEFIEQLRTTCAYATTSALSLPIVAAGTASLQLLSGHPEMIADFQQRCLKAKKILCAAGYDIPLVPSPVISIHLSGTGCVNALKKALIANQIYPSLIRYPGKSDYFRFALSSVHTKEDISSLLNVLCGLRPPV